MSVLSQRTIEPQLSSRSLSVGRKRKGISLSNEKENKKLKQYPSVFSFESLNQTYREKNVKVDKFIIYDMNRWEWQMNRNKKATEQLQIKKPQNHAPKQEVKQIKVANKQCDKQNQWHFQNFNPHLKVNNFTECKRRQRNRAQQIRNRINQIENRLNSLMVKNRV